MKTIKNQARYRKLSEPFENVSKANEAVTEFYAGVEALREKCKLPDIHIIVRVNATTEGGEEADAFSTAHLHPGRLQAHTGGGMSAKPRQNRSFSPPPHENAVSHAAVMKALRGMSKAELVKTLVDAEICTADGKLTPPYRGDKKG